MHSFTSSGSNPQRLGAARSISDLSLKLGRLLLAPGKSQQEEPAQDADCSTMPGSSTCSEADENYWSSVLGSVGEESMAEAHRNDDPDDVPELNVESIHTFIGSNRHHTASGIPKSKVVAQVSGTGLAPWEIHRPQKFVRDLVLRRCFSGRVLDAGCGIGDNALYVAKACPGAKVTAVDVVPRCLEFAAAKANLRNMRSQLDLVVGDLLQQNLSSMPAVLGPDKNGSFNVVLDSSFFHSFSDADRDRYVSTLRRLLRPGGLIYMNCMSEEETRPGGPRRISVPDLLTVFNRPNGWEVETIEDSIIELHPTFWDGKAKARLFTIRKL
ncbi:hypothetical protein VOLCADRAFT_97817 [Volvox carteri f. nagariensis]|uniref:Methyltransferase domain-containing protein n=1 Tax=Volvox carteri f. nagariensis TaxID=3068 RepID=D8UDQ1_VOLCA|nr:uncharacterized protein VOLCADRAFT_97817 [Volvox carteri f. nagariensis]EFJ42134.1 hypothetical protein VOLCADRAFT_97817 [Volvox carteri f. nagariensis]|eukprot:XP_002956831.1 hypothetical protein VOLCADRAFT_97817 [Volvox carteri f. nagariensis]